MIGHNMKRYSILFLLFLPAVFFAQQIKFAVISQPAISDKSSAAVLDSVISNVNSANDINYVFVLGDLTKNGTAAEAELFKESIQRLLRPYFILPGIKDFNDANCWEALKEITDNKFSFEENGIEFIGLSPVIPLNKVCHFTQEDIDWMNSVLDTVKIGDEFYFFTPFPLDNKADNWESILELFQDKFPQLIIDGSNGNESARNFKGFSVFDAAGLSAAGKSNFYQIELSADSVLIKNPSGLILTSIDKAINILKDTIASPDVQSFNADIIMQTELNSTMLTSTTYWNGHIYTSDESGLISCIDSTGKVLWDYDTNGDLYSKPVIANRMLTAATYQGDLTTISAISGEQIQSIGFEEAITSDLSVMDFEGSKELMIPKLTKSKAAIVFGTASGKVFCYDLETLQEFWSNKDAQGMIRTRPLILENKILYTSRDGFLYCIDARDGLLIWRWREKPTTDFSDSQIFCDGKKVFVVSSDGILYAINLMLGKLEWKQETLNAMPNFGISENKQSLFIQGKDAKLFIVQTNNGKVSKEIKLGKSFTESLDYPVEINGDIIYSINGTFSKANTKSAPTDILFLGNAPTHPLITLSGNKFLSSNIDGRIIIFSLR
jgi:outer membrane protein assembly factor BamB